MNPIPLRSPSRHIYAYACGVCHHVAAGTSLLCPPETNGPHPTLVERSKEEAEACCVCRDCGAVIELDMWGISCGDCRRWYLFGYIWPNVASAIDHDITTEQEWNDAHRDYGDDDED